MRVAGKLKVNDWEVLEKKLEKDKNENWEKAFQFFEERIKTRYLSPIEAILKLNENQGEGFAVVTLQCSLIETIESFINGWVYSSDFKWYNKNVENGYAQMDGRRLKKNQDVFISFFSKRIPFKGLGICGECFFKNVRCALLHETQTKNHWLIKKNSSDSESYYESPSSKIIYRDQFQRDIKMVISNYKDTITQGKDMDGISTTDLRENFRAKFNHLCNQ